MILKNLQMGFEKSEGTFFNYPGTKDDNLSFSCIVLSMMVVFPSPSIQVNSSKLFDLFTREISVDIIKDVI